MDRMEDLLTCSVCCEGYQEKLRHPVLLPRCGHSFCRPCVAFLVKSGCVVCPTCRTDQRIETVEALPTEFSLLAITSAQNVTKLETCQSHDVKLAFWCRTCNQPTCGECLFEDHPTHTHDVIKATRYIDDMKQAVSDIANKFVDGLDGREKRFYTQIFECAKTINDLLRTISVLRKDMEDARELIKGSKTVQGVAPTTQLSESAKFLGLKWSIRDLNLCPDDAKKNSQKESKKTEEKEETGKSINETDSKEKDVNEQEKALDEPTEPLNEEEEKKRRKIARVKEKLAAAAAAADKARAHEIAIIEGTPSTSKNVVAPPPSEKDVKVGTQNNTDPTKKSFVRKSHYYTPVSREPSITPEREFEALAKEAEDLQLEAEEAFSSAVAEGGDPTTKEEKGSNSQASGKENVNASSEAGSQQNTTEDKGGPSTSPVATQATTQANTPKDQVGKTDMKAAPSIAGVKRPRGRMARQALKRAQTINLAKCSEMNGDVKPEESDNIKGLDLETSNQATKNEEETPSVDNGNNNDEEQGETSQVQEEEKEEEKNEDDESVKCKEGEEKMFEMEPEEKERLKTELLQVPSLTVAVEGVGGRLARMEWETCGLHIYCHQYQELPYDVLLKSTVLHALIPTKSPMVFLDIGAEQKLLGRIYIKLWGHLRRAHNFLLLCLGDRGVSYRNSKFLDVMNVDYPGERIKGGDYEYNNGLGGEALIDNLEYQGEYSMPMEMGMITSAVTGSKPQDSQFYICTEEDLDRKFSCPFGKVTFGLHVLKEAIWLIMSKQIWIHDCGVVLEMPKL